MDKTELVAQLAGRMKTSEQQAELWLEAVLDVLHGSFAADASTGGAVRSDEGSDDQEATGAGDIPVLRSITPTARLSIGDEIVVDRFPFRVGREARVQPVAGILGRIERRSPRERTNNELYVKDFGKSVNVSREHFQIEAKSDGSYELVDRGSACGTIVGSHVVGGNFSGGRCPLQFGDAIVVGTRHSAIVFEFSQAIA